MAVMVPCLTVALVLAVGQVAGIADSCYGSLGCFSNGYPWTTLFRPVPPPKSPEFLDTHYYLYTRNAPNGFTVKNPSTGVYNVDGSDFDGSRPTIFVVHGWTGNGFDSNSMGLRNAAIAKSDANVIVVDWAKGASDGTRLNSASNARVVAATTFQLLKYLQNEKGVNVENVHFIGFSMGAHISGYVAKAQFQAFQTKIGRITALDASQTLFEKYDKVVRLDVDDAVYIDAIHTDARLLAFGHIGPVGHSDFYVNGGWGQPSCLPNLTDIGDAASSLISSVACSHVRSVELFVSSATLPNCQFWGHQISTWQRNAILISGSSLVWTTPCNGASCSQMGFDSIHYPARGSFDVKTSTTAPYCVSDPANTAAMAAFYIP